VMSFGVISLMRKPPPRVQWNTKEKRPRCVAQQSISQQLRVLASFVNMSAQFHLYFSVERINQHKII
jgi:hypothetical protein